MAKEWWILVDRIIWIIEEDRNDILDAQRKINAYGGMKAMCILSVEFMNRIIEERIDKDEKSVSNPSLILVDHRIISKNEEVLGILKMHPKLASVPMFFLVDSFDAQKEEEYYLKGAMVVVEKPLNKSALLKIDSASGQYDRSKSYERILQKQISELESAKAIKRLNTQLENRNEFLYRIFGKYFSDELLDIILDKQEGDLIGGEKVELAVLFSDLRGFTSVSESMDPESITQLLNCYFGAMSKIIIRYGGTIIEFLGDGILAVFGAPSKSEKYCANAIAAAIEMQNAMNVVNDYCNDKGYDELQMGVGIHCGEAFVGNVGTEQMMRYNVIGSVVNTCSRIESYSIGGQVLASENIVKKAGEKVYIADETEIQAKGVSKALKVCALSGIGGSYNSYLDRFNRESLYLIDEELNVEVFTMENKIISEFGQTANLKLYSKYKIKLELDGEHRLEPYMDVLLRSKGNKKICGFAGVYAKVSEVHGRELVLNITKATDEYKEFGKSVEGGKVKLKLEWRTEMKNREDMLVTSCTADDLKDAKTFFEKPGEKFILGYMEREEDVCVYFYSKDKSVRALEFVDFLMGKYGTAKGDGTMAWANISKLFLNVFMSELEMNNLADYFEKKADEYYNECDWIFATEYIKDKKKDIEKFPVYKKKTIPWAYVKTTDIVQEGKKFRMKSLENETDMVFEASPDLYIMIGCRGEIYNISEAKFVATYRSTEEKFDIFMQMPDYIPEVQLDETEEYVSLDDKAYLCYPKDERAIYATPIDVRTKVFSEHNKGEYFVGSPGDYMAVREDDISDIYIIQREIFEQTYEKVK